MDGNIDTYLKSEISIDQLCVLVNQHDEPALGFTDAIHPDAPLA